MTDVVLSERPDGGVVASTLEALRRAEVLGDTWADFGRVISTDADEDAIADRLESIGRFLGANFDAARWWIGEWLLFGEAVLGDRFYQIADAVGLSESTLLDYRRVVERIARSRRNRALSWSHHRAVAAIKDPERQAYWLARAEDEELTTRELRDKIDAERARPGTETSTDEHRGEVVELRVTIDRSIAVAIAHQAQPTGDGAFRVPAEPIARLRAAIGMES